MRLFILKLLYIQGCQLGYTELIPFAEMFDPTLFAEGSQEVFRKSQNI